MNWLNYVTYVRSSGQLMRILVRKAFVTYVRSSGQFMRFLVLKACEPWHEVTNNVAF